MKKILKSVWVWLALAAAIAIGWFKRPRDNGKEIEYYDKLLRQNKQAIRDEAARRRRLARTVNPSDELPNLLDRIRARKRADDGDSA